MLGVPLYSHFQVIVIIGLLAHSFWPKFLFLGKKEACHISMLSVCVTVRVLNQSCDTQERERENVCRILIGKPKAETPLERPCYRWQFYNIEVVLKEIWCEGTRCKVPGMTNYHHPMLRLRMHSVTYIASYLINVNYTCETYELSGIEWRWTGIG
jgi:hypothetical protein